jgi:hypothetical protein
MPDSQTTRRTIIAVAAGLAAATTALGLAVLAQPAASAVDPIHVAIAAHLEADHGPRTRKATGHRPFGRCPGRLRPDPERLLSRTQDDHGDGRDGTDNAGGSGGAGCSSG